MIFEINLGTVARLDRSGRGAAETFELTLVVNGYRAGMAEELLLLPVASLSTSRAPRLVRFSVESKNSPLRCGCVPPRPSENRTDHTV